TIRPGAGGRFASDLRLRAPPDRWLAWVDRALGGHLLFFALLRLRGPLVRPVLHAFGARLMGVVLHPRRQEVVSHFLRGCAVLWRDHALLLRPVPGALCDLGGSSRQARATGLAKTDCRIGGGHRSGRAAVANYLVVLAQICDRLLEPSFPRRTEGNLPATISRWFVPAGADCDLDCSGRLGQEECRFAAHAIGRSHRLVISLHSVDRLPSGGVEDQCILLTL